MDIKLTSFYDYFEIPTQVTLTQIIHYKFGVKLNQL